MRYNHFHDQLLLSSSSDSRVILNNIVSLSSEPFGHLDEEDEEEGSQEKGSVTMIQNVTTFFCRIVMVFLGRNLKRSRQFMHSSGYKECGRPRKSWIKSVKEKLQSKKISVVEATQLAIRSECFLCDTLRNKR